MSFASPKFPRQLPPVNVISSVAEKVRLDSIELMNLYSIILSISYSIYNMYIYTWFVQNCTVISHHSALYPWLWSEFQYDCESTFFITCINLNQFVVSTIFKILQMKLNSKILDFLHRGKCAIVTHARKETQVGQMTGNYKSIVFETDQQPMWRK